MKSESKSILIIVAVVMSAFALGYFLSKNEPKQQNIAASAGDGMAGHHGGGTAAPVNSAQLDGLVGKALPDIQFTDKDGKLVTNLDFKGKATVLFFNEGLMCYPACWNQMASFGSDPRFDTNTIQAVSIVVDPAKDWQTAISKMPELAKAKTLFDGGGITAGKLGLLTLPSSMHRGQLPGHTYIVLDKDGIVRYVRDDPSMALGNDLIFSKIAEFNK